MDGKIQTVKEGVGVLQDWMSHQRVGFMVIKKIEGLRYAQACEARRVFFVE